MCCVCVMFRFRFICSLLTVTFQLSAVYFFSLPHFVASFSCLRRSTQMSRICSLPSCCTRPDQSVGKLSTCSTFMLVLPLIVYCYHWLTAPLVRYSHHWKRIAFQTLWTKWTSIVIVKRKWRKGGSVKRGEEEGKWERENTKEKMTQLRVEWKWQIYCEHIDK